MVQGLRTTYSWVREKREVLFKHCESLPKELFAKEVESFGWGSIRNLHVLRPGGEKPADQGGGLSGCSLPAKGLRRDGRAGRAVP
jgi:hypothetical protein